MNDWNEYQKKWQREHKKRLRSQGMCTRCGKEKAASGRVMCPACLEKERMRSKEAYAWCKEKGICVYCHKNRAAVGYTWCEECASKRRAKYREKRDAGTKRGRKESQEA